MQLFQRTGTQRLKRWAGIVARPRSLMYAAAVSDAVLAIAHYGVPGSHDKTTWANQQMQRLGRHFPAVVGQQISNGEALEMGMHVATSAFIVSAAANGLAAWRAGRGKPPEMTRRDVNAAFGAAMLVGLCKEGFDAYRLRRGVYYFARGTGFSNLDMASNITGAWLMRRALLKEIGQKQAVTA